MLDFDLSFAVIFALFSMVQYIQTKEDQALIILLWIMKQSGKQHTDGEVKKRLKLVLGSRDSLEVGQVEEARWQSGELVLRETDLP